MWASLFWQLAIITCQPPLTTHNGKPDGKTGKVVKSRPAAFWVSILRLQQHVFAVRPFGISEAFRQVFKPGPNRLSRSAQLPIIVLKS